MLIAYSVNLLPPPFLASERAQSILLCVISFSPLVVLMATKYDICKASNVAGLLIWVPTVVTITILCFSHYVFSHRIVIVHIFDSQKCGTAKDYGTAIQLFKFVNFAKSLKYWKHVKCCQHYWGQRSGCIFILKEEVGRGKDTIANSALLSSITSPYTKECHSFPTKACYGPSVMHLVLHSHFAQKDA